MPEASVKKIISREWLYLLSFAFLGFIVIPALFLPLMLVAGENFDTFRKWWEDFYGELGEGNMGAYLFGLGPYIIFQFIRSIKWAIKTSRE